VKQIFVSPDYVAKVDDADYDLLSSYKWWSVRHRHGGLATVYAWTRRKNGTAKKWMASIKIDRTPRYLGLFVEEHLAAEAYDEAAKQMFGVFAKLNFPEEEK
jgi:hypothetical protein